MEQGSSFHYEGGAHSRFYRVLQHNRTEIWFPPMVSSQGALPTVRPPSGLVRTSSLGTPLINLDATSVILIFVWVASPCTTLCIKNASK